MVKSFDDDRKKIVRHIGCQSILYMQDRDRQLKKDLSMQLVWRVNCLAETLKIGNANLPIKK
jgi:hypothetical protein